MRDPVLWVGGWASHLACWSEVLRDLYPDRDHAFLDAHAVLRDPGLLPRSAADLPAGGTLVAWSMGSLLLHRSLAAREMRPDCRLVSACPIFDFCREDGPWPSSALARMARNLTRSREPVLAGFLDQVRGNSPVTQAQTEAWLAQAGGYSLDSLLEGLEALGGIRMAHTDIPAGSRIHYLASELDPLAPPKREDFSGPGWTGYPQGHLPFLDYPHLLRPILDGDSQDGPE